MKIGVQITGLFCVIFSVSSVAVGTGIQHIPSKFHGAWAERLAVCANPENDIYIVIKNSEYLIYEEECYLSKIKNVTVDSVDGEFFCLDIEENRRKIAVNFHFVGNKLRVSNVFGSSVELKKCKTEFD